VGRKTLTQSISQTQYCGFSVAVNLIVNAAGRCSLEEVRKALQERMQRWQLIQHICGFDIISNPGLPALELQLKPALKTGIRCAV